MPSLLLSLKGQVNKEETDIRVVFMTFLFDPNPGEVLAALKYFESLFVVGD